MAKVLGKSQGKAAYIQSKCLRLVDFTDLVVIKNGLITGHQIGKNEIVTSIRLGPNQDKIIIIILDEQDNS